MVKFYRKHYSLCYKCMRITTLIIGIQTCITTLLLAHGLKAQSITIDVKQADIKQVFTTIEKQTGIAFVYNEQALQGLSKLTIKVINKPLEQVLKNIAQQVPLQFKQSGNVIGVSRSIAKIIPKEQPLIVTEQIKPPINITGKVNNASGQSLPGVTIKVKDTNISTITDNTGSYHITVPDITAVLLFSYVGMIGEEVAVNGRSEINVTLMESVAALDQVKVIAYGTTTQRTTTGNVSTVNSETIQKQPITNLMQALIGQVPGLLVKQTSGLPQLPVSVQIRGRNSISSSNEPLYVVDGVPYPVFPSSVLGFTTLNDINPGDVESISILKDADATSIYGSRGANGVILITTRKGKGGRTQVSASYNTGISSASHLPEMMNTAQYLQMRRDAFTNSSVTPTITNAPDLLLWDTNTDDQWQKWYLGNHAKYNEASASFSGGSSQTTFSFNGNYHAEGTIHSTDENFRRGGVHFNLQHHSFDKRFIFQSSAFYTSSAAYRIGGSSITAALSEVPNYPIYNSDGTYNWTRTSNMAAALSYGKNVFNNLNSNVLLQYSILPGLDIKSSIGYTSTGVDLVSISPARSKNPTGTSPLGNSTFSNVKTQAYIVEPQLTYKRTISKGIINFLAGGTIQRNTTKSVVTNVGNYTSDLLLENPGFGTPTSASGQNLDYRYLSAFGRITFTWDDKYIINGTFRRDGSTRFGDGRKFGNFGSIGAAWIFTDEPFIKNALPIISYGKLRGSWGTTGNDGIGDYQYLSTYSSTQAYGANIAVIPSRIANTDYSWEVNKKLEFAAELGLIKNRILFTTAWYRNRSGNQLINYPLPPTTGFTGYIANLPALVENTGWEFELRTKNINSNGFIWDSAFNLTIPSNRLVAYPNIESSSFAGTYVIGQSLNLVQLYHFLGVDPQNGNGLYQDIDNNGSYVAKSSFNNQGGDYLIAGNTDPKFYGGLNNTLSFKGLQLDFFFQFTKQKGYNLFSTSAAANKGLLFNGWSPFLNYWKQSGDVVTIPKPSTVTDLRYQSSDAGFGDASFIRLRNIQFAYSLPKSLIGRLNISNARIFLQGENLLTLTNYFGYDPEMSGTSNLAVPSLKTITAGLQCTF
jgi:TonB-linked SusC/RagA family outer membrane protein